MAMTIRPKVRAMPTWVTWPLETSSMTMAPVPAKTRAKAPRNSARGRFMGWRRGGGSRTKRRGVEAVGLGPSGGGLDQAEVARPALGHLRAAGVAGAEEQHAGPRQPFGRGMALPGPDVRWVQHRASGWSLRMALRRRESAACW